MFVTRDTLISVTAIGTVEPHDLTKGWSIVMPSLRVTVTFLLLSLLAIPIFSVDLDFAIDLQQRKFTPDSVKKLGLAQKSTVLLGRHIIMQFDRPLLDQEKERLADDGVELLSYIPNLAYTVKLTREIDETLINQHNIRWFGEIFPDDKISPLITALGIGDWARREGGRAKFTVVLHKDEDINFWSQEFERLYDAEITGLARTINAIELIVPELAYLSISEQDAVIWIEQQDPPPVVTNNIARINTRAEELQAAPYNLTGDGVIVAEWDGGQVDNSHGDLVGRVMQQDNETLSDHATHVAGTVLGSGAEQGGTYRGMAPGAMLLSHLWWRSSSELETEYDEAILNGALVSTNSWGMGVPSPSESSCQSSLGYYASANAILDEAIRGNVGFGPISICWSAGNERSSAAQYCGFIGWTYHTIGVYGCGKNLITVGALASGNSEMTDFSSWGPTDDGRIKPDVCGPGCSLRSCAVGGGYWNACGTSMSTPATAGTIALMLEALHTSGLPLTTVLPSTIKGILINTAVDLGLSGLPNGPDYAFGHGKVDGVAAVDKIVIGDPSYLENIIATGTTHQYDLTVPGGAGKLKVTLVWDDPGGVGIAGKDLINDLDLELVDPFSSEYKPWVLNPALPSAAATTGIDRTNNVETVEIASPTPGLWKARVSGFNVPSGPQNYSLVFTPDSISTPGNLAALAVFDQSDVTKDPGDSAAVSFWVTNVGANSEVVDISISDNVGWLRATVESTVSLAPWDSVYFQVIADVPGASVAGAFSKITCAGVSQVDSQVTAAGSVNVIASAYYDVALLPILADTVDSPQQFDIQVIIDNNGNAPDRVVVDVADDLGWLISPDALAASLPAFGMDTLFFQVFVPAEVPHLQVNNFDINAASDNGSGDTIIFQVTVDNPYLPPQLISPADPYYTQNRLHSFNWSGTAESFRLVLASDTLIQFPVRVYSGLTTQSFTMPAADSLSDGYYYWGVKLFVNADSSSFQANTRLLVVDNGNPQPLAPQSPANSQYVTEKTFTFVFGAAKSSGRAAALGLSPEFARIQLAKDAGFTDNLIIYEPIITPTFTIPDIIAEGRWYWRVEQVDSAGNTSGLSSAATFILDTQTPAVPTLIRPLNGTFHEEDTIVFKWSLPPPPAYVHAGEYFRIQASTSSQFLSILVSQFVYTDSLKWASSVFTPNVPIYWRVRAHDSANHISTYQPSPFNFTYSTFVCGDVNGDQTGGNILDLNFLVNRIFRAGPTPNPLIAGSVNCDLIVNILDLNYLVNRIFRGGPPPCCL